MFLIEKFSPITRVFCSGVAWGVQMHKVIWDFFEMCPNAETCVSTETEKIGTVIHSLGLQNKRAKTLQRFSQEYLGTTWTNVTQLHGVGE